MSLKSTLLTHLQTNKHMTFQEMEQICRDHKKKTSNGEKRLRDLRSKYLLGVENPDYDPNIGIVTNEKNAIIAYTYAAPYTYMKASAPTKPVIQYRTCCFSFKTFQTHGSECPIKQGKEVKTKGQLSLIP